MSAVVEIARRNQIDTSGVGQIQEYWLVVIASLLEKNLEALNKLIELHQPATTNVVPKPAEPKPIETKPITPAPERLAEPELDRVPKRSKR